MPRLSRNAASGPRATKRSVQDRSRAPRKGPPVIPASSANASDRAIDIRPLPRNQTAISLLMWDSTAHSIATSASVATYGQFTFSVSLLADTTLFASFEQYRISAVDVVYKPNSFTADSSPSTGTTGYAGWFAFDPDDNATTSVGGVGGVASKNTAVLHSMCEQWSMTIHPRPSVTLYQSGAFSGYSTPEQAVWVDSDNLSVEHFGLKYAFPPTFTAAAGCLYFRYHVDAVMNQ
jgi:hypothetical protein